MGLCGFCSDRDSGPSPPDYASTGRRVRCHFCRERCPEGIRSHAFYIYGRGKHDGRWMCDVCLASRSGR